MARFDDQDRGFRSDEVRGPIGGDHDQRSDRSHYGRQDFRDSSYETPANYGHSRDGRADSPGGVGGYGNTRNPAWAGHSANLESDHAGRGSYGAAGYEGTQGYGRYRGEDSGRQPSHDPEFDRQSQRHYGIRGGGGYGVYDIGGRGAEGYHRVANETYDDMRERGEPRGTSRGDVGYGTRHWGQGEYLGDDRARGASGRRQANESTMERLGERIGQQVGRFFGVGPKGYRRSDERILDDIHESLANHHDIDASEIEVKVTDGLVQLTGTVDTRRTRRLVEESIEHVPGLKDIENHLRLSNYVARTEEADQLRSGGQANSTERPDTH